MRASGGFLVDGDVVRRARWSILVGVALLLPSVVFAESGAAGPRPVVLVLAAGSALDFEQLREAVENELEVPVVAAIDGRAPVAHGTLVISPLPGRRLLFSFHPHLGGEVRRTLELGEQDDAMLTSIALLAGNLARDQTTEILEDLLPGDEPPEPPPVEPTQPPPLECPPPPACAEQQCPPVPACEEPVEPPQVEIDVRERAFTDRWAVGAYVIETFSADSAVTRIELGGSHRWGAFSIGLSGSLSHRPLCTLTQCVVLGQYTVVAEAEYRARISRRGIVELGGAVGVAFHRLNGHSATALAPSAWGRIQLTLVVPLIGAVELVFRNQLNTSFVEVDFPDSDPDSSEDLWHDVTLSPWEIGVGIGVRAHF